MNRVLVVYAFLIGVVAIVAANTFFVVDQREQAIVLQLGEPVRVVHAPTAQTGAGLNIKVPFLQHVIKFDRRNLALEADQEEIIASDEKRLVVDAFLRYRISDPLQYYRTLRNEQIAEDRLQRLINSSLRQTLGSATQADIISDHRAQLMLQTRLDVERRAKASRLGIEVIDLRIRRVDLPAENRASVYKSMQTQRQQIAAQIRAQGEQQKREILAAADKEVTITLANARETGETTRGEGDAMRTRIFAQAFGKDPGFAAFFRSMQAYVGALAAGDTTMILSPNSEFFRYLKQLDRPKER